jgi:hypothetical protein
MSQIVQTPGDPIINETLGIIANGSGNSIYSDGTNHLASTCCEMGNWTTQ